jgi:LAS superfamily LD-carboxypeptidase LdcB
MLNDWVTWMKSNGFKGNNGNYISVISGYRTVETQEEIKNHAPNSSAIPGTSMHGWGIAVDFNFYNKDGKLVKNYINNSKPNLTEGYNFKTNPALEWLYDHSYQYGWIIPEGLRNDFGVEEFWHFEYHGKSALCILKQRPLIKGHLCVLTNL